MSAGPPQVLRERLRANVIAVRARMEAARRRGAASAEAVQLVAVTKAAPPAVLPHLHALELTDVGENRAAQAKARRAMSPEGLRWHGIGHLQRNKARTAMGVFDVLHAVDRHALVEALARHHRGGPPMPCYLQVNASGEVQKSGIAPEQAIELLTAVLRVPAALHPIGWMTMARGGAEEHDLRQTFRTLRGVREEAERRGLGDPPPPGLSMGMSGDFEIAIEEGATVVRVGSALMYDVVSEDVPKPGASPTLGTNPDAAAPAGDPP